MEQIIAIVKTCSVSCFSLFHIYFFDPILCKRVRQGRFIFH